MYSGIVNRKVEMEYTQRQLEAAKCITRKATPEELEKILNERGNAMGKRGPQPGFKRDKRININELADKAVIQASKAKKDLAEAARANIEKEIETAPVTSPAEKVTEKPAPETEKSEKVTDPIKTIQEWDTLVAQTKGAVLQEREDQAAKSLEEAVDASYKAKYGMTYAEFKAKQEANFRGSILVTPDMAKDIDEFRYMLAHSPVVAMSAGGEGEFIDTLKASEIKLEDYMSEGNIKAFMHDRICKELNDLYVRKNHDYGDSFSETYRKLGIISAVTRITDKVNRIQSLCTKKQMVNDESLRDTLRDLANYAIMTIIEMEAQG